MIFFCAIIIYQLETIKIMIIKVIAFFKKNRLHNGQMTVFFILYIKYTLN